ncbi:hypothetical protein ElyMa_002980100 [Elysia marginata]|uniref:TATA box binding protein associated factor (TAF) histone-like fold domain-containing protein n=1 Tax=Elysia marginata TaxID=1093978 RepID=A0AAV4I9E9_9GAST|nr:hypothetical protein ElyMa_002980100 [Elysia marginata]
MYSRLCYPDLLPLTFHLGPSDCLGLAVKTCHQISRQARVQRENVTADDLPVVLGALPRSCDASIRTLNPRQVLSRKQQQQRQKQKNIPRGEFDEKKNKLKGDYSGSQYQ